MSKDTLKSYKEFVNFLPYIRRQKFWSEETFGPGLRTKGIINHIKKELIEVEEDPLNLEEWIDIIILALDGAWRTGNDLYDILKCLQDKQYKNINRKWPDWRTFSQDEAIEHVKE